MNTETTTTTATRIQEAIHRARNGDEYEAAILMSRIYEEDPKNESVLVWMTYLAHPGGSRNKYLSELLALNPDNAYGKSVRLVELSDSRICIRPPYDDLGRPRPYANLLVGTTIAVYVVGGAIVSLFVIVIILSYFF